MSTTTPAVKFADLKSYAVPDPRISISQIITSFVPYIALWGVSLWLVQQGRFWLSLPVSVLASLFLVRIFILQHDCGHGSFFAEKKRCTFVGRLASLFTFTPYAKWRDDHNQHHARVGKLEGRGVGDIMTWTVDEYRAATPRARLGYRLYRNPWLLFSIGAIGLFLIGHRIPGKTTKKLATSVHWTTVSLVVFYGLLIWLIGWKSFLMVQLPIIWLAATMGVWLFYVQHQFADTYWRPAEDWSIWDASLLGSSYYDLPPLLQWLTGNIGLHHIHHLNAKIPNYRLQEVQDTVPQMKNAVRLDLLTALRSLPLALWDPEAAG